MLFYCSFLVPSFYWTYTECCIEMKYFPMLCRMLQHWTYTECCIEIVFVLYPTAVGWDWTYTECCIEIIVISSSWRYDMQLNLYRMLYWNEECFSAYITKDIIEPIQNVVLKSRVYTVYHVTAFIEPIQNVVLKCPYQKSIVLVKPHWTYTECCIEIQ